MPHKKINNINADELAMLSAMIQYSKKHQSGGFSSKELKLADAIYTQAQSAKMNPGKKISSLTPCVRQSGLFGTSPLSITEYHFAMQKILVRQTTELALQQGVKQIVFLGGSYDPYSYTLALENQVQVFELAESEILGIKMRGLMQHAEATLRSDGSYQFGNNAHFLLLMANGDWLSILKLRGFKVAEKTLFVIESFSDIQLLDVARGCQGEDNKVLIGIKTPQVSNETVSDASGVQIVVNRLGFNLLAKRHDLGASRYYLLQSSTKTQALNDIPDIPLDLQDTTVDKTIKKQSILG